MESETEEMIAYRGSAPFAFVSYSHNDSERVMPIIKQLQSDGYRVWFDEGIEAGKAWAEILADRILASACVIAFLTSNYLNSENCLDELGHARAKGIPILIVFLESPELPGWFEMRFGRTQAIMCSQYGYGNRLFRRMYEVQALNRCRTDGSEDSKQSGTAGPLPDEVYFKASFSAEGGDLFIYSRRIHNPSEATEVQITENLWNAFAERVKALISAAFQGIASNRVALQLMSPLGRYKCAPNDGFSHFDECYRLRFRIQKIGDTESEKYDSVRFEMADTFEICLFKNEKYAFRGYPEAADLAFFGINESIMLEAAKQFVRFAVHSEKVIIADSFRKKVYSDGSGGFHLDYILT